MLTQEEIRELCRRVTTTKNEDEFRSLLSQLRSGMREHIQTIHNRGLHLIPNTGKSRPKPDLKTGTGD
jgi:hypothetical protein